jgi:hypothetical protein
MSRLTCVYLRVHEYISDEYRVTCVVSNIERTRDARVLMNRRNVSFDVSIFVCNSDRWAVCYGDSSREKGANYKCVLGLCFVLFTCLRDYTSCYCCLHSISRSTTKTLAVSMDMRTARTAAQLLSKASLLCGNHAVCSNG